MDKSKRTRSDVVGGDRKGTPGTRDPSPTRKRGWNPADDIYGDPQHPVDADLDFGEGKFAKRPPKP